MNKKKKTIIVVFAVLCVLGAVSWYLVYGNPDILKGAADKAEDGIIAMYGGTKSYDFYPADQAPDVDDVRQYNGLDRQMYYTNGAETFAVYEEDLDSYGDDVKFFFRYFKTVIAGDHKTYNSEFFTDDYFEENEKTCDFTPQMLYDIHVEKLTLPADSGKIETCYNVSYKIFHNNGTFRNDIGSDGSKTLRFYLTEKGGKVLIDRIEYYV